MSKSSKRMSKPRRAQHAARTCAKLQAECHCEDPKPARACASAETRAMCHCEERVVRRSNPQSARWRLLWQKPPRNDRAKVSEQSRRDEAIKSRGDCFVAKNAPRNDNASTHYEIKVEGRLDARWTAWFDGMTVTALNGETLIAGPVVDQSKLRGILNKIWDLNLTLISVNRD